MLRQSRPMPMKTENEPLSFGINDLMNVTKQFLDTRQRDVLYEVDSTMARKEPTTLRLSVNNFREEFEAACLHGWHKRITRVELARRLEASTESLGHGEGICKSWEDFAYLKSIYIDVAALLDLTAIRNRSIKIQNGMDRRHKTMVWFIGPCHGPTSQPPVRATRGWGTNSG